MPNYIPHDDPRRAENLAAWHKGSHQATKNDNGSPRVYYHGSNQKLDVIMPGRKDPGAWFTTNKQNAANYARGHDSYLHEVYLKSNNPMVVPFDYDENGGLRAYHNGKELPFSDNVSIVKHAQKLGYDGVHFPYGNFSEDDNTFVVFDPHQIKSVDNDGHFRTDKKEIDKSEGGAVDVNHPEFRRWFGKSVTHQEGQPVKFYHGTSKDKDFNKFKMTRHGVWLTTDPEEASMYAKQNDSQNIVWDGLYKTRYTNTASRVIPVYAKIENPYTGEKPEHVLNKDNYKKAQSDWFDSLRMKGYDGWIPSSSKGSLVVALGHSGQIKSALTNTGEYDDDLPMHRAEGGAVDLSQYQDKTGFGLYSHAAETAAALPQAKGTPDQMKSMLMKQGVKPAEIEHSNYDDVFGQRPSVTKDELVQHFRQSMPTIKEHVLKRPPDLYAMAKKIAEENGENWHEMPRSNRDHYYQMVEQHATTQYNEPSKFDDYSMPGGENYREILLQLKRNEDNYERQAGDVYRKKSDLLAAYDKLPIGDPRRPAVWQQIAVLQHEYNQLLDKANETQQVSFKSGHWDQPDILAHLRMKDRTGPNGEKILHVDEIQSDWGQQGRGGNFQNPRANEEFEQYIKDLREKLYQENVKSLVDNKVKEENRPRILEAMRKSIEETSPEQVAKYLGDSTWAEFDDKREKLYRNAKLAPRGPYVTNTAAWTDLALKRALHEAAAGGYDKMIFTPGEEQANRYDLSNYVNSIHAFPDVNGKIHLNLHDNDNPDDYPIERIRDIDPNELHKHVGKEVADRILSKVEFPKEKEFWRVAARSNGAVHIFGDELENIDDAKKVVNSVQDIVRPHLEIEKYKKKVGGKNAVLRDLDLKIGGEGMRHFYDKLVPKQLMEITKRHDPEVKIKPDVIDTPEGPKDVHAIDITPKLRESVLRGQKAFAEGGAVDDDGITAYHGSPHDFDEFDLSKIGTGEGAQAYGHGLYFAESEPIAKHYRDTLSNANMKYIGNTEDVVDRLISAGVDPDHAYEMAYSAYEGGFNPNKQNLNDYFKEDKHLKKYLKNKAVVDAIHDYTRTPTPTMYEVRIKAHPDHFLDWDKPLREQKHFLTPILEKFGGEKSVRDAYAKWDKLNNDLVPNGQVMDFAEDHPLWQEYNRLSSRGPERTKIRLGAILNALDKEEANPEKYRPESTLTQKGEDLWHAVSQMHDNNEVGSNFLREMGIPGIKYFDARSRSSDNEKGTRNYVVFDDKLVGVKRKYAYGGFVAA